MIDTSAQLIDECNKLIGPPPRQLDRKERKRWRLRMPIDMLFFGSGAGDVGVFYHQRRLRERGWVTWGAVIQANDGLFRRGWETPLPAIVIYCADSPPSCDLHRLRHIAARLAMLKGKRIPDPNMDQVVQIITSERTAIQGLQVPELLAEGSDIRLCTFMVHRKHLPNGVLSSDFVPLVVNPDETQSVMILPSCYWPQALVEFWTTYAAQPHTKDAIAAMLRCFGGVILALGFVASHVAPDEYVAHSGPGRAAILVTYLIGGVMLALGFAFAQSEKGISRRE